MKTLLHTALLLASYAQPQIVECLLAAGADVTAQDENGVSSLMWSAGAGRRDIVQPLLDAGADKTLRDNEGATAADRAQCEGHQEIVSLLAT